MKPTHRKEKVIRYRVVKVISKPILVEFYTKGGEKLFFKGVKGVEVVDPEKLETKDLIKWLNKNGLKSLAKALRRAVKMSNK